MRIRWSCMALVVVGSLLQRVKAEEPAKEPVNLAVIDGLVGDSDREHWAFTPVARAEVPAVKDASWVRTPLDAFVLARLEQDGWRPNPPAERRRLLRRLFLDLTGVPPTLDEQDQFLSDDSPEAFERVVDDLLSRPSYGERWGRHWLDLVRYAETNGYERDGAKPSVWRFRDYVIDAFNADKPYDRFIVEQLAGDELPDANAETIIATGFHRLGPWDDEPADYDQDRFDQLDDIIRTTSQAFLGVTLGCARCHNHKFDPLTQADYYRMAAVMNTLKRPQNGRQELDLPAGTVTQRAALLERDRKIDELMKQIATIRDSLRTEWLASGKSRLPADAIAAFAVASDKLTLPQKELVAKHTPHLEAELLAALSSDKQADVEKLRQQIARLRQETPDLPRSYFMTEGTEPPTSTFLLLRGQASARGPEVQPGVPVVLTRDPEAMIKSLSNARSQTVANTSGRRLAFARWIASPENPLTARVIVNRVWQYHFGEGLVRTPSDFGIIGETPSHPELLDWLAHWFVRDAQWSLKKLHRLILTSGTYRMSNADHPEYSVKDPRNVTLWRFPFRRLEVEAIRDSMLAVTGQLRRQMHGPGVYLEIPPEVLAGNSDPNVVWPKFDEATSSRRTVYAFVKRALVVPFLEVLDVCDTTRSTELRNRTTIAPQALTLFNGDFVNRQARHFADRLQREAGGEPAKQIELAFRLSLCRSPTPTEIATMTQFLNEEATALSAEAAQRNETLSSVEARHWALIQLCRVVLNTNEFLYSD